MKIKKSKLLQNTIMLYILIISNYIFNFITIPYQTRIMGPEIYGKIGLAFAISVYFKLLFDFGFILSATEDVSKEREDKKKISAILSEVLYSKVLLIILGLIIFIVITLFSNTFKENKLLFFLYFIYVAIDCLQPDFLYRGIENMKIITIRNVIVKFIFMILVFIFLKKPNQYLLIPIFNILGSFISLIWVYYDVYIKLKIKIHKSKIKNVLLCLKKSFLFFISRIATTLYGATNTLIIGLIYPTGNTLGYYTSSDKILTASRSAVSPISDSIYPYMVKNRNFNLIKKILKILMPIITLVCIIVFIYSKEICILLFGDKFAGSSKVLRYMIPIIIMTLPSYLLGFPTMSPLGLKKQANYSVVIGSVFHIVSIVILYLLGILNLDSLCILTIITEFLILLIRLFYIFREVRQK